MLASAVSTGMLEAMAKIEGFHFEETLTGFKWLGNVAIQLQKNGFDARYAFEEAIGYMFSDVVHDKDAVAAGTVFLTAVQHWRSEGLTPWGKLQQLYERYGHFESVNSYFISPSSSLTSRVFENIRTLEHPHQHPASLGTRKILRWRDLTEGYDSATSDHIPMLPTSKDSQMITCVLDDQVKFTVRGSGTEPKIKRTFYLLNVGVSTNS
jgi:phosphoglucomutase